jgi:RimJ/RimL family protein N-acetyltransferase
MKKLLLLTPRIALLGMMSAAPRAAAAVDPGLPVVAWIHEGNVASQAVARHLGLRDYGLREADHWKGEPMHYWADRGPVPG